MNTLKIDGRVIGVDNPPYIIAEMSGNHNGDINRAMEIIAEAKNAGADAVKLQTYTPDTITIDFDGPEFQIKDGLWAGSTLYDLYKKAYTPWEWHETLFSKARKIGITIFSSPFDETAVNFLESLDVPAYKIASFENNHLPLIRKVAATGKPIIISTGMATLDELKETVRTARDAGCKDLILLKCTSAYPGSPENSNILTIPHMRQQFDCEVGLSDHTMGVGVSVAAVAHGATIIEKHFTLDRADGGVDSTFSLEPGELNVLVTEAKNAWQGCGGISYGPTKAENKSLMYRRSLFIAKDMKKGDILTPDNLKVIRPGNGLHPRYYDQFLGKRIGQDVKKGTAMKLNLISSFDKILKKQNT